MDDSDMYLYSSPDESMVETSSFEDEGNFFSFGRFTSLAKSINKNIESVAHTINSSAKAFMNELVEMEQEAMLTTSVEEKDVYSSTLGDQYTCQDGHISTHSLPLPWEGDSFSIAEQEELRDSILALSKNEHLLLKPFASDSIGDLGFHLDETHIDLIHRLMKLDPNLGKVHSKFSGKKPSIIVDVFFLVSQILLKHSIVFLTYLYIYIGQKDMTEEIFWNNYFYQCTKLRENKGLYRRDDCFDAEEVMTSGLEYGASEDNVTNHIKMNPDDDFVFVQEEDLY